MYISRVHPNFVTAVAKNIFAADAAIYPAKSKSPFADETQPYFPRLGMKKLQSVELTHPTHTSARTADEIFTHLFDAKFISAKNTHAAENNVPIRSLSLFFIKLNMNIHKNGHEERITEITE